METELQNTSVNERLPFIRSLKRWLKTVPVLGGAIHDAALVFRALRNGYLKTTAARLAPWMDRDRIMLHQGILKWTTQLPDTNELSELAVWFDRRGVRTGGGTGSSLYLPPQDGLSDLLGGAVDFYPEGVGFVIEIMPPGAGPFSDDESSASDWAGEQARRIRSANHFFMQGVGPRLHDVTVLRAGERWLSASVVEHIAGGRPSEGEFNRFLQRFREINKSDHLTLVDGSTVTIDDIGFPSPDCDGKLLTTLDSRETCYVDTRSFAIAEERQFVDELAAEMKEQVHFGTEIGIRGGRYLYQSLPTSGSWGRRDSMRRWKTINELLERSGLSIKGRTILDLGCNSGMMMAHALSGGAGWGIGWDVPDVARRANEMLMALGLSRFMTVGAEMSPDYDLTSDIPAGFQHNVRGAIVFHLAVRGHFGFPTSLEHLPWKTMVYESHESESLGLEEQLAPLAQICKFDVVRVVRESDGDSAVRTIAVLERLDS